MRLAARLRVPIAAACIFFFTVSVFAQPIQIIPVPGASSSQAAPSQETYVAPSIGGTVVPPPTLPGTVVGQTPGVPLTPGQIPQQGYPQYPQGYPQGVVPQPAPGQTVPGYAQPAVPGQTIPPAPSQAAPPVPGLFPPTTLPSGMVPPAAPPALLPGEEASAFEDYVAGRKSSTISFDIKQFGYDIFRMWSQGAPTGTTTAPTTGAMTGTMPGGVPVPQSLLSPQTIPGVSQPALPVQSLPVDSSYTLGPGDEVRVTVWGSIEGNWDIFVDRDGNITLPKVGVLGVTGLNFSQLKSVLQQEFSKYYTDFEMNVSMGALKSIRVYVVGNARNSGVYLVPSLSSTISALAVAGGPSKAGSLRDIQIKRNGETTAHLDVYDLLLKGDRSGDIRLQGEDVIFIPPIGPLVGVAGSVERPAIYELKGKTRLSEAIKMAGGATADAYLHRVQVERVAQRASKVILDQDLQKIKGQNDILLENGDIVKVFPATTLVANRITLKGNVLRPGDYEWRQGVRVRDILPSFDLLGADTLLNYALVERLVLPDYHLEYLTFNLEKAIGGTDESENICLQPFDTITVFNKSDMSAKEKVRIAGAVNKPGDFEFRANMKVGDLVRLAGGLRRFAYTREAELTRVTPTNEGPKTQQVEVNLVAAMAGDPGADLYLQEDDYLFVRSVPDWQIYRKVTISGEVKFPGEYPLNKGEKLSTLIERAGGFTDKAYLRGAVFTRQSVKDSQQKQLDEMVNRLERELLAMSASDQSIVLTPQDAQNVARMYKERAVFVQSLRNLQPQGRMVIVLERPKKLRGTFYDLTLEEGDSLHVPENPHVVQVVGAVMSMGNYVYEPGRDHMFYINMSGGFNKMPDEKQIFIMKVDGTAIKPDAGGMYWDSSTHAWQSGQKCPLEPGDVIVVPDKLSKWEWLAAMKDFAAILLPIAIMTRVVFQ